MSVSTGSPTGTSEVEYRKWIQETYQRIEKALSGMDPDVLECEQSMGALTLTFSNQYKCILSAQPSVRQLWLANASRGIAHHFNYNLSAQKWLDDKGQGIELFSFLESMISDLLGEASPKI